MTDITPAVQLLGAILILAFVWNQGLNYVEYKIKTGKWDVW